MGQFLPIHAKETFWETLLTIWETEHPYRLQALSVETVVQKGQGDISREAASITTLRADTREQTMDVQRDGSMMIIVRKQRVSCESCDVQSAKCTVRYSSVGRTVASKSITLTALHLIVASGFDDPNAPISMMIMMIIICHSFKQQAASRKPKTENRKQHSGTANTAPRPGKRQAAVEESQKGLQAQTDGFSQTGWA